MSRTPQPCWVAQIHIMKLGMRYWSSVAMGHFLESILADDFDRPVSGTTFLLSLTGADAYRRPRQGREAYRKSRDGMSIEVGDTVEWMHHDMPLCGVVQELRQYAGINYAIIHAAAYGGLLNTAVDVRHLRKVERVTA